MYCVRRLLRPEVLSIDVRFICLCGRRALKDSLLSQIVPGYSSEVEAGHTLLDSSAFHPPDPKFFLIERQASYPTKIAAR